MEMEAATPLPKKRRSEVPGSNQPEEILSHEPTAAAMEAPGSEIREPPAGAGGAEDGVDHISGPHLQSFITGCPVLESVLLNHCTGFSCIRICSPNLRTIGVCVGYLGKLVGISIEDAPCLERLLQLGLTKCLDISIISAPNLETMGRLRYDEAYGFSFKGFPTLFPVVAHTVKTLSITVVPLSVDMVLDLMCCFPCLEKLYIQIRSSGRKNLWCRKHQSHIRCLDIRLKKVVLANYRGIMSEVNFAMLFVLNAKMLELLRFEIGGCCGKEFIER